MGLPQTESPTPNAHLYPEALQLKIYQAFIFSIPVLFSIILILLFYLFYLRRRASHLSRLPANLPPATNQGSTYFPSGCQLDIKEELKEKLVVVIFDEELQERDTVCCVCLGEFRMEEELLQVPSCKHVFHEDCLHHWLHSSSTCPLCRCPVFPTTKLQNQNADSIRVGADASSTIRGSSDAESVVVHITGGC